MLGLNLTKITVYDIAVPSRVRNEREIFLQEARNSDNTTPLGCPNRRFRSMKNY